MNDATETEYCYCSPLNEYNGVAESQCSVKNVISVHFTLCTALYRPRSESSRRVGLWLLLQKNVLSNFVWTMTSASIASIKSLILSKNDFCGQTIVVSLHYLFFFIKVVATQWHLFIMCLKRERFMVLKNKLSELKTTSIGYVDLN